MKSDISNLKVGVVTVTYNSEKVIEGFMRSLLAQKHENFILYVVDNASSDKTIEFISNNYNDSRIVMVSNKDNLGVAEGNNQGIKLSLEQLCDYVLLINNDTEFEDHLLDKLIEVQLKNKNYEMITTKIMFFDNPDTIWCAGGYFKKWMANICFHYGEGEKDSGQYDNIKTIEYAPTCCLLIKPYVFEKIGLMDERYFVYYDDTDFCLRASANKIRLLYYPYISFYHKVSSLTQGKESPFTTRYLTRNLIFYIRKNTSNVLLKYVWIFTYFILLNIKFLVQKDNFTTYKLKQNSLREGMSIPLP